jgi:hypothetical protein
MVTSSQVNVALAAAVTANTLVPTPNTLYVVLLRAGQVVYDGTQTSMTTFCAYHSFINLTTPLLYAVFPNEAQQPGCAFAGPSATPFDNMTPILAHELVEMITDPATPAWISSTGDEVADICAHSAAPATTTPYNGSLYWVQYLYSNSVGGCYADPVTPTLSLAMSSPSSVTATLTAAGAPLANQALTLIGPSTTLSATTSTQGTAHFTLTAVPGTVVHVTYAGAGPVNPAATTIDIPSQTLSVAGPTTVLPGASMEMTATISPAPPTPATVTFTGPMGASTATTVAGVATTTVLAPSQPGPMTIQVTVASLALSTTYTATVGATTLSMTATSPPGASPADVLITTSPAMAGLSVTVQGTGTVVTATTDATGVATLSLSPPPGAYVLTASAQVQGAQVTATLQITVNPPLGQEALTLLGPSSAPPMSTVRLVATVVPASAGQLVTLTGPMVALTSMTASDGSAVFDVSTFVSGPSTYTASAVLGGTVVTTRLTLTVTAPSVLRLHVPSVVRVGTVLTATASITPAVAGQRVTLMVLPTGTSYSAVTSPTGVVAFPVRVGPTQRAYLYQVSTSSSGFTETATASVLTVSGEHPLIQVHAPTTTSAYTVVVTTTPHTVVVFEGPHTSRATSNAAGTAVFHVVVPSGHHVYRVRQGTAVWALTIDNRTPRVLRAGTSASSVTALNGAYVLTVRPAGLVMLTPYGMTVVRRTHLGSVLYVAATGVQVRTTSGVVTWSSPVHHLRELMVSPTGQVLRVAGTTSILR